MKDSAIEPVTPEMGIEELALNVASRIRSIRTRHGLTPKDLAIHSEVSECYLAQVERGSANISLALLSRITNALEVPTGELLLERDQWKNYQT